ncbi:g11383 [Coccomyxa elongata]
MSREIELPVEDTQSGGQPVRTATVGLSGRSLKIVAPLSALFALDSFAGSLVTGTLLAYYFQQRFAVSTSFLGGLLFTANIISGASSLSSGWIASRVGLINTMVFTHLPSNVLTMLIPLMPSLESATAMVFLRYSISQMDVAPRQSFLAGIVSKSERTATMGIVNVVKSLSNSLGPLATGYLAGSNNWQISFFLCGGLKIVYDILLLFSFSHIKPDVEAVQHISQVSSEDMETPLIGSQGDLERVTVTNVAS